MELIIGNVIGFKKLARQVMSPKEKPATIIHLNVHGIKPAPSDSSFSTFIGEASFCCR